MLMTSPSSGKIRHEEEAVKPSQQVTASLSITTCLLSSNPCLVFQDHFSVKLCARENLPEFSSHDEHDSYRFFRSEIMDVRVNLEMRGFNQNRPDAEGPKVSFFSWLFIPWSLRS